MPLLPRLLPLMTATTMMNSKLWRGRPVFSEPILIKLSLRSLSLQGQSRAIPTFRVTHRLPVETEDEAGLARLGNGSIRGGVKMAPFERMRKTLTATKEVEPGGAYSYCLPVLKDRRAQAAIHFII
eukprot:scaffold461616_cov16-Prasinocladus_malaysianus.AAC.1